MYIYIYIYIYVSRKPNYTHAKVKTQTIQMEATQIHRYLVFGKRHKLRRHSFICIGIWYKRHNCGDTHSSVFGIWYKRHKLLRTMWIAATVRRGFRDGCNGLEGVPEPKVDLSWTAVWLPVLATSSASVRSECWHCRRCRPVGFPGRHGDTVGQPRLLG
jgi:hypothetical protein